MPQATSHEPEKRGLTLILGNVHLPARSAIPRIKV